MPELAEVAFFARQWRAGLDAAVLRVDTHPRARVFRESPARQIAAALEGRRLREVLSAGKQAAFRFSDDTWLGVHLGMSGRLFASGQREDFSPWAENAAAVPLPAHDHLALAMDNGATLVYNDPRMFGVLRLHVGPAVPPWWASLPPPLTSPAFTPVVLRQILARHPGVLLKTLLMNQNYFPGIGNWMADEILWRMRLSPHWRAGAVSARTVPRLRKRIREVCAEALRVIGETWYPVPDDWLFNHRWHRGGQCPRDGTALRYDTLGGRTSCWCPRCQAAPPDYNATG